MSDLPKPEVPDDEEVLFKRELSERLKAELRKKAHDTVQAEIAKQAKDDYLKAEVERLRLEAGISSPGLGGTKDELVEIVIDLANEASQYICINMGQKYWHGVRYKVPRHLYDVFMEIMQAQRREVAASEGKSVWRHTKRNHMLSGATNQSVARPEVVFEEPAVH